MHQAKSKFMKIPRHPPTVTYRPVLINDFVSIMIDKLGKFMLLQHVNFTINHLDS